MTKKLMSQAAFAREIGVSRQRVNSLVRKGVIRLVNNKVDPVQAKAALAAMREPARQSKAKLVAVDPADELDLDSMSLDELLELQKRLAGGEVEEPTGSQLSEQLLEARVEHEREKVRLARLKADAEEGRLVVAEEVERRLFELARMTRNAVLAVPDRTAAQLAGIKDPAELHRVLSAELRAALSELADELAETG